MKRRQELKEEWLKFNGLGNSEEDQWLLHQIASLFDVEHPTEAESRLLWMVDLRLTLADLPPKELQGRLDGDGTEALP